MKDRDVLDALLISGFFLGYAMVLAIARRVPRPAAIFDSNRLAFMRTQRDKLIDQENMSEIDRIVAARRHARETLVTHGDD